ncbi:MAG: hypothetical protein LAO76_07705 [Acidobacteriia bacterium]|nr:hypothetical protein [Terriglobia bacterium]
MKDNRYLFLALVVLLAGCFPIFSEALQAATKAMPSAVVPQASLRSDTVVPVVQCNTIDDGVDDDGFLDCMQGVFTKAQFNTPRPPQKNNIEQAIQNLMACSPHQRTDGMVVGHGGSGFVRLGNGNLFRDATKFIADLTNISPSDPWNRKTWFQLLQNSNIQNSFNSIILFSCEAGSEKDGALLLNDLAAATNTRVLAPTSLVKCDRATGQLSLLGGELNEARPGAPAQVKHKPKISRSEKVAESNEIKLPTDKKDDYRRIPFSSIKSICMCRFPSPAHPQSGKEKCFDASKYQKWLVSNIFFATPFQPSYIIGADVTGYIEITFGQDREDKVRFNILNDELLVEPKSHTYYYVTDMFEQSWAELN